MEVLKVTNYTMHESKTVHSPDSFKKHEPGKQVHTLAQNETNDHDYINLSQVTGKSLTRLPVA